MACRLCRTACIAGGSLLLTLAVLVAAGVFLIPLPAPAHGKHAHPLPPGVHLLSRPRPLTGELAPNRRLSAAVRLFEGRVVGAESVTVGPAGQLVMLDRYNQLWQAWQQQPGGGWVLEDAPRAHLGAGRPLGYHHSAAGDLLVADSLKGLISFSYADSSISLLATHISAASPEGAGEPITYANDLDVAPDGRVFFTSCTDVVPPLNPAGFWDTYAAWFASLMQGRPRGRLLAYDPASREAVVVASGFYYANGVALSAAGDYLVLAETDALRLHKVWLQGPKAGTSEVLLDRLPGVPDGVDRASDGGFWVSLVAPAPPFTSPLLASALLDSPLVRGLHAWLAAAGLRPRLRRWGAVLKVDGDGGVADWLLDPDGHHVSTVSAVSEHAGRLFLGNLVGNYVSYIDLGTR